MAANFSYLQIGRSVNNDLFVSLEYNRFTEASKNLEGKLSELIACRHEYPIWPSHGGNPVDIYEIELHSRIRHQYYHTTLVVLRLTRALRKLA